MQPRRTESGPPKVFRLDLFATFVIWVNFVLIFLYSQRFAAAKYSSLWPFTTAVAGAPLCSCLPISRVDACSYLALQDHVCNTVVTPTQGPNDATSEVLGLSPCDL